MSIRPSGKFVFLWLSIVILLFALLYKYAFVTIKNTPQQNAMVVEKKLTSELDLIEPLIIELKQTLKEVPNPSFSELLLNSKYPYFIFTNRRMSFWSSNLFSPKYRDIIGTYKVSYVATDKGKYIVRKEDFEQENRTFEIVFMIPLTEQSKVINQYLKSTVNEDLFTDSNFDLTVETGEENGQPVEIDGVYLFSLKFGSTYSNIESSTRSILVLMLLMSLLLAGAFIKKISEEYVKANNIHLGFLFILSCLLIIRSLMLLTGFPSSFAYLDLFDPIHYASSLVNPSLGDLLLNLVCLMILGLYVFNNYLKSSVVKNLLKSSRRRKFLIAVTCIFFSFFWLAVHHQTMKTLNFDSRWSMDISQDLNFDYLKVIGYVLFFLSVVIYFLFAHVCFRLYIQLGSKNAALTWVSLALGTCLFIGFAWALQWDFVVVVLVNLAFIFIIRYFDLPRYIDKIQYLTFIYFFSFGLPGAIIGLYANFQFTQNSIDFNKSRLAYQLLLESDLYTEPLFDAANMIKDDLWIRERIVDPFASKKIIESKIKREYLNSFDKFDIKIYAFNARGQPFDEFNLRDNYHALKAKLTGFETDTEGLYFNDQAQGSAVMEYLSFIELEDRDQVIGYILLDLTQKRLVPNSVFPLLLSENRYARYIEGADKFSYGVFKDGKLQYNFGTFNYRKSFDELSEKSGLLFEKSILIQGYYHKAFAGEDNKVVIVSAAQPSLGARFANFSFLFLIYVFSILIFLIVVTFYQTVKHIKLNYATKIQLYLNFAFFTPLIIVSVTTVSIIIQTFKTSLENQYLEYAQNLSTEVSNPLSDYRNLAIDKEGLSEMIFQIAKVADLDVNVFHNKVLVASSLFQIYQNEILSRQIEPRAYIKIAEEKEMAFVQEEQVGLLNYKNVYVGIRSSDTGLIIGILSLPFFASQRDLENNIVEVLSNIINIFTFVFIIFMFVSFFVSRGLTFPLQLITQKIKRTTLASYNEPLSWNSDDEIGLMVTEYNRMLVNLEESKRALARNEKESAWREMARQVAHEIKNPLTPMKLTLQHMKRVVEDETGVNAEDKKMLQINNLLEQIEVLSDIATSFSDFAKMPTPKVELIDLRQLLSDTIELYNKKELGEIVTNIEQGKFMINGDRKWLGRSFSNLIINGFQAASDAEKCRIKIGLFHKENGMISVVIEDNGQGIPEHIQDKVFSPNFSTKYTGSGLGLAITKKGIEHANGNIWFESREGVGTTFYIDIPSA